MAEKRKVIEPAPVPTTQLALQTRPVPAGSLFASPLKAASPALLSGVKRTSVLPEAQAFLLQSAGNQAVQRLIVEQSQPLANPNPLPTNINVSPGAAPQPGPAVEAEQQAPTAGIEIGQDVARTRKDLQPSLPGKRLAAPTSSKIASSAQPGPVTPEMDPGFQSVTGVVKVKTKREKAPPIIQGAQVDQASEHQIKKAVEDNSEIKQTDTKLAAKLPLASQQKETQEKAHLSQLDQKAVAQPLFTEKAFMDAFQDTIKKLGEKLPKNKDEKGSDEQAAAMRDQRNAAKQSLTQQNQTYAEPYTTELKKDPASLPTQTGLETEPVPLKSDNPGGAPTVPGAQAAAPKPKKENEVSLEDKSRDLDDVLTNNTVKGQTISVDEGSLSYSESGEKSFDEAGESKRKAQAEIEKVIPQYREQEAGALGKSKAEIRTVVNTGLYKQYDARSHGFGEVLGQQKTSEGIIVTKKKGVFADFQKTYDDTKLQVVADLKPLDSVEEKLTAILSKAEAKFEEYVRKQLEYIYTPGVFDYSDWIDEKEVQEKIQEETKKLSNNQQFGNYAWLEARRKVQDIYAAQAFETFKSQFIFDVRWDIEKTIAPIVVSALNQAKKDIETGQNKVKTAYDELSDDEKKEAETVYSSVNQKFELLAQSVDERKGEILNDMAKAYNKSVGQLNAKYEEIKKDVLTSWFEKAWNKLKAVINAIIDFATKLFELLGRLVYLVGDIISSPRAFFRNLVTGIGQGFSTFASHLDVYLVTAFFDWLRGSSGTPIQIPNNFGAAGIFSLFTQLLGLSTETIWERMEVVYNKTIANAFRRGEVLLGKGLEVFEMIKNEGLGGLWEHIKESLGDMLSETLDTIKETILFATIRKVIEEIGKMLIPGGGFIAIAEKILRLLEFIVEARDKILKLIELIVDSVEMAVKGDVSGIATHVIEALTSFISIAIDFLVNFFGLSSLHEKVESILNRIKKPIIKGIDWLLGKLKPLVMRIFGQKDRELVAQEKPMQVQPGLEEPEAVSAARPAKTPPGVAATPDEPHEKALPDFALAKQTVKHALDLHLPNGAMQVADVEKVLAGVASRVKPAFSDLRAEEFMPGKAKAEGAIGFKVIAKLQTGKDSTIDSVRFSQKGKVLTHEERWELGVKGVKRAITQLEKRGISEETIRAQFPVWQAEFGFSLLILNMEQMPWWIEGEMSAGRRVTVVPPVPADPLNPMASAPGIGEIQRHGNKPSSLRDRPQIWQLESEHILPFATGKTLWQALALYLPERDWPEDNQQTTIMIYERAARIKTPEDNRVSASSEQAIGQLDIAGMFAKDVLRYKGGDENAIASARQLLEVVLAALESDRAAAVVRTNAAIVQENGETEAGFTRTNAHRRAPPNQAEPPTPASSRVEQASKRQIKDLLRLVTEELLSNEEMRNRMDRLLNRPDRHR